jgi:MOSC domain-containing protein YiiM
MPELTGVHRSLDDLNARYARLAPSPTNQGAVKLIVVRPDHDVRETPQTTEVTNELGFTGDHWSKGKYADRPEMQVAIMNSRVLDLIAGGRDRWALAGDNLIADLDLSTANLPPGQPLAVGSAVLEVSETPHRGCAKFSTRFGADALRFVNRDRGKDLRLRGVYAQVTQPGTISVGDLITKI